VDLQGQLAKCSALPLVFSLGLDALPPPLAPRQEGNVFLSNSVLLRSHFPGFLPLRELVGRD
jgi:hypothetical protein